LNFNFIVYIDYFNYHQIQYLIIHKYQLAIFINQFGLGLFWAKLLEKFWTKVFLSCHWSRLFIIEINHNYFGWYTGPGYFFEHHW